MGVNRRTIIGSEAHNRDTWGPLPWVISAGGPQPRRLPTWFRQGLVAASAIALAYLAHRCGALP